VWVRRLSLRLRSDGSRKVYWFLGTSSFFSALWLWLGLKGSADGCTQSWWDDFIFVRSSCVSCLRALAFVCDVRTAAALSTRPRQVLGYRVPLRHPQSLRLICRCAFMLRCAADICHRSGDILSLKYSVVGMVESPNPGSHGQLPTDAIYAADGSRYGVHVDWNKWGRQHRIRHAQD